MKKIKLLKLFIILNLIFNCSLWSFDAFAWECSQKYSALVFNPKNKEIFFEKEADKIIYPASLTKLMTLYLVFEAIEKKQIALDEVLTVSNRAIETSKVNKNNTLNLTLNDQITVRQAIQGSIVKSFNELTILLAERVAQNEWQFVRKMNKKAKELAMNSTNFHNSSGLHNVGQFTTNEDLAKLTIAIKENFPQFYHFFALKKFTYKNKKYLTHNHFLAEYKGAEGLKTGFTKASGFNLIAVAKNKDNEAVSIVTGCESWQKRDNLTKKLMNLALDNIVSK